METDNYSLYKNTKTDTFYKSYYESIGIEKDSSDMYIIVAEEFNFKPGKLALTLYGSEQLWWIFTYFNRDSISDPVFDLQTGKIIRVPTKERLLSYF